MSNEMGPALGPTGDNWPHLSEYYATVAAMEAAHQDLWRSVTHLVEQERETHRLEREADRVARGWLADEVRWLRAWLRVLMVSWVLQCAALLVLAVAVTR